MEGAEKLMSQEIDNRIVSLEFDNSNYERNVKQTMKTTDALRDKLNINCSNAFSGIDTAATNASRGLHPLSAALDLLKDKTAWAETAALQAMLSIEKGAINCAANITKALTITPISSGLKLYEAKLQSIQTTMGATGRTIQDVEAAIRELNDYSDATIYNFQDMTTNLAKFTNAGVSLEDSVMAIKGVENAAARAGATALESSRAVYNFAQSLAMGYVQYIDWKSIENANMSTVEFKTNIAETAAEMGMLTKTEDGYYECMGKTYTLQQLFKDALKEQWFTSEVLVEVLKKYSDETTEIGKASYAAAKDIKSFSQMFEVLGNSAKSTWANTFQLIFGDLNDAKAMLKKVAEPLSDLIQNTAKVRDHIIGDSFTNGWDELETIIADAGLDVQQFEERLKYTAHTNGISIYKLIEDFGDLKQAINAKGLPKQLISDVIVDMTKNIDTTAQTFENETAKLEYFQEVVDQIWNGEWSNNYDEQREREQKLTAANYNFAQVQELVNKTIDGHRLSLEDLTETQMKALDFTEEEIQKVLELQLGAKEGQGRVGELLNLVDRGPSGSFLWLDTLRAAFNTIKNVVTAMGDAFDEVLGNRTASGIYNVVNAIHALSIKTELTDEKAKHLKTAFKDIYLVIDILVVSIGRLLNFAGNIIKTIFPQLNKSTTTFGSILDKNIEQVHDWFISFDAFEQVFEIIKPSLERISNVISKFINGLTKFKDVGINVIKGFQNGLLSKADGIYQTIKSIFMTTLEIVQKVFRIHSPSKEMYDLAIYVGQGFINGIKVIGKVIADTIDDVFGWSGPKSAINKLTQIFKSNKATNSVNDSVKEMSESIGINAVNEAGSKLQNASNQMDQYTETLGKVWSKVKVFFGKVGETLSEVDWGAVAAFASLIVVFKSIKNIADKTLELIKPVKDVAEHFNKLQDSITGMFKSGKKLIDAYTAKQNLAQVKGLLLAIGVSVLGIALACKIMKNVSWEDMGKVGIIIVALGGIIAGLYAFSSKVGGADAAGSIKGMISSGLLIATGAAILAITGSIAVLFKLLTVDEEKVKTAAKILALLMGELALCCILMCDAASTSKFSGLAGVTLMINGMATAMIALAFALKLLSSIDPDTMKASKTTLAELMGLMAIVMILGSRCKPSLGAGLMIASFASTLILVGLGIKVISSCSVNDIAKATAVITAMGVVFAVMILFSKGATSFKRDKNVRDFVGDSETSSTGSLSTSYSSRGNRGGGSIALMFMGFAASMLIMGIAIKTIAKNSVEDIIKATAVITAMSLIFDVMMVFSAATKKNTFGSTASIVALAASVAILAGIATLLGKVDENQLKRGITALAGISVIFDIMMLCSSVMKKNQVASLITLTVCIGLISTCLVVLGLMDPDKTLKNAASLSMIFATIAAMFFGLSKMKVSPRITAMLTSMTIMIGVICASIAVLNSVGDTSQSLKNAGAIAAIISAMAITMKVISSAMSTDSAVSIGKVIAILVTMGLLIAEIAIIFYKMKDIDADSMIKQAGAISLVLVALGAVGLAAAGMAKIIGHDPMVFVTAIAGISLILAAIAGIAIGAAVIVMNLIVDNEDKFNKVGNILGDFGKSLAPLAMITGLINGSALSAVGNLLNVIQKITKLKLEGNTIAGADNLTKVVQFFPKLASSMVEFSNTLTEGKFDSKSVEAAAACGNMIANLQKSLPKEGGKIQEWFGTNMSMDDFKAGMVPFAEGIRDFADIVNADVDYDVAEKAAAAGNAIAELETNLPRNGGKIAEWLGDREQLRSFSGNIKGFAYAISNFAEVVCEGNYNYETVEAAGKAGLVLAKLENNLPRKGGKLETWLGSREGIRTFSNNIKGFASGIKGFSDIICGGTGASVIDAAGVEAAANAGLMIAKLENSLDTHGGKIENIFGDTDLSSFSENLGKFGTGIKALSDNVNGFDMSDDTINKVCTIGLKLADLENGLDEKGGALGLFFGDKSLSSFATGLGNYGTAIHDLSVNLNGTSNTNLQNGITGASLLGEFTNNIDTKKLKNFASLDTETVESYGINIASMGDALITFNDKFAEIDTVKLKNASESIAALMTATKDIKKSSFGGLENLVTGLGVVGDNSIDNFCISFENCDQKVDSAIGMFSTAVLTASENYYATYESIGKEWFKKIQNGMRQEMTNVNKVTTEICNKIKGTFDDYYMQFYSAGQNTVTGYLKGIEGDCWRAAWIADDLGKSTVEALRKALDIHSPSRETYAIGEFFVKGFVNGVDSMVPQCDGAIFNMGQHLTDSVSQAVHEINENLSGVDGTVITPVLDLSNVEKQAGNLSKMFEQNPEISANLGKITMSYKNKTDNSDKIVKAIENMDTSSTVTNNYNVAGISYDDGSAISSAIGSLIDAAEIARRV